MYIPSMLSSLLASSATQTRTYTLTEIFDKGGIMMWPILVLSALGLTFAIIGWFVTGNRRTLDRKKYICIVEDKIKTRDYSSIIAESSDSSSAFAAITAKTLSFLKANPSADFSEIREVAQAEGSRRINSMLRKISWLSDVGAIAPMFGLLGTVTGMIRTFLEISNGNFEGVKQMQMSEGVAEALLTTAFGLIVGIPALLAYAWLRNRANRVITDLEAQSTHLLALLSANQAPSPHADFDRSLEFRQSEIRGPIQ